MNATRTATVRLSLADLIRIQAALCTQAGNPTPEGLDRDQDLAEIGTLYRYLEEYRAEMQREIDAKRLSDYAKQARLEAEGCGGAKLDCPCDPCRRDQEALEQMVLQRHRASVAAEGLAEAEQSAQRLRAITSRRSQEAHRVH